VKAQVAANRAGINALHDLILQKTLPTVTAYLEYIRQAAAQKCADALANLPDGKFVFSDAMDDGTPLKLTLTKFGRKLVVDFSGSGSVHRGILNANRAIVESAVMYVARCLIAEDIPLNGGILAPIDIVLPECFLNPQPAAERELSPAVSGGNVETSQRIVDVLLGGLGIAAASQGTMNNWLIGDSTFGYYETIGGGSGATADGPGADAIHVHMSNTRLTDPEVLESRYPIVLRQIAIRKNSGGEGRFRGGNGMIRELEFTRPLTLTLLSSRRTTDPFGVHGGKPGARGENTLIRAADAAEQLLPSQCELQVSAGDRLRLLTPGGGGYGRAF
jgi:5-oxoprolinase (ATP-hydrolysing)